MYNIEKMKNDLKETLSDKRYIHCLGVMKMAESLAIIHKVNVKKAKVAGLLHDIAKEMPKKEIIEYIRKNHIRTNEIERNNLYILHGKIGADIAKKKYHIDDDIMHAIEYHTTTDKHMNMLAKIIYIADKTEMNRKNKVTKLENIRQIAKKDIDEALFCLIQENIKHMLKKGELIHPKTIETRNILLIKKKLIK